MCCVQPKAFVWPPFLCLDDSRGAYFGACLRCGCTTYVFCLAERLGATEGRGGEGEVEGGMVSCACVCLYVVAG